MTKALLLLIAIILTLPVQSQHSKKYKKFANKIKVTDSILINKSYKNGSPKEIGNILIYESETLYYEFGSGKWAEYYSNGNIKSETLYDNFGLTLYWKFYNKKGELRYESKALKIDTSADNMEEFLHEKKYIEHLSLMKKYKFSKKLKKSYLYTEGQVLNQNQIGKWKKYNENGEITKEKIK